MGLAADRGGALDLGVGAGRGLVGLAVSSFVAAWDSDRGGDRWPDGHLFYGDDSGGLDTLDSGGIGACGDQWTTRLSGLPPSYCDRTIDQNSRTDRKFNHPRLINIFAPPSFALPSFALPSFALPSFALSTYQGI